LLAQRRFVVDGFDALQACEGGLIPMTTGPGASSRLAWNITHSQLF
jgi:hypothetical protein